jgi:hypothetical protein
MQARGTNASGVKGVPLVAAGAEPSVFFAGRPAAERTADAWGAEVLLVLKVAILEGCPDCRRPDSCSLL